MASLRFNFEGERRPERGRGFISMRSLGFPIYGRPLPFPEPVRIERSVVEQKASAELETALFNSPEEKAKEGERREDSVEIKERKKVEKRPGPEEDAETGEGSRSSADREIPEIMVQTASEKLLGKLEVFETGLLSTAGQLKQSKVFFDEVIYKIESFQQILDILRANADRNTAGPKIQAASEKTARDSIDDFLELLQTPAFQNVLRQLLLNVIK